MLLPVGDHMVSTAICYEVIYPESDAAVRCDGSELLTTITNDAWYGRSSAAYQHWDQASMRAIERGRYLARAANTGISGFVDPYGRVLREDGALSSRRSSWQDLRFLQRPHDLQPHRRPGRLAVAARRLTAAAASSLLAASRD